MRSRHRCNGGFRPSSGCFATIRMTFFRQDLEHVIPSLSLREAPMQSPISSVRHVFVSATRVAMLVSLGLVFACGGGSEGATSPNGGSTSGFHMTAKVDGAAFVASNPDFSPATQVTAGNYTILGLQSSTTAATIITLSLANIRGPGTYPLGVGPQVPGGSVILAVSSAGWASPMSGADGSITITSLSTTEIAGTFNFVVTASLSGTTPATRTVTEGDFRLPVKQLAAIGAIPDKAGSTLTMSANGSAFTGAFVQANLNTIAGSQGQFLVVSSSNSTRGFGFSLSGVTGPGTYALGNTSTVTRQMQFSFVANVQANSWSSIGPGSSGSVIITSLTATRIKGTFSGVLGPTPGFSSAGVATITNGVFDIGLP